MAAAPADESPTAGGWLEEISRRLSRPRPEPAIELEWSGPEPLRPAAVLVPLYVRDRQLRLLLTLRTETVEHHKGQVSFPGGTSEPEDAGPLQTALRETEEELGVPAGVVQLLGELPKVLTVTGFEITPFVGAIPWPLELEPEGGEVAEILEVPLAWLLDPASVSERTIEWGGRELKTPVYTWDGNVIWGATARIVSSLAEALRDDGVRAPRPGGARRP